MANRITASKPAGYATISGARIHNVIYPADPLAFTLDVAGATSYTVRDFWGTVVDTGSVSGTTVALHSGPFAGKLGSYRLQLSGADAGDGAFGTDKGTCFFTLLPDDANYPIDPLRASNPVRGGGLDDLILHGVLGAGLDRVPVPVSQGNTLYQQDLTFAGAPAGVGGGSYGLLANWYFPYADGVRERPFVVAAQTATVGFESGVTQTINDLYANWGRTGIYFEGRNEPIPNAAWATGELTAYVAAVRAGSSSANAKAVASGPVSLCEGSGQYTNWLAGLDAGAAALVDVDAFHDYNMCNGDLPNAIVLYEKIAAALAARGLSSKKLFVTEGGYDTTWGGFGGSKPFLRLHDTGALMKHTLVKEITLGVQPEQTYYYYDRRNGFDSVTTWQATLNGSIYPGFVMLRTYTAMVRGKTFDRRLDFGDGHYHYLGGVWSAPSRTGAKVAVIVANSVGLDPVSCFIGGNPATVTVYDCFGNASTLAVTRGVFTIAATDTPQYVAIPDGVAFDVRPLVWGPDVLPLQTQQPSNSAQPAATATQLAKMADGDLRTAYYFASGDNTTAGSVYVDTTGTFPKTITIAMPFSTAKVTRLTVETPVPWQDTQSLLLDFDIQYRRASDGVWVTAQTFTHASTAAVKNYSLEDDTAYDLFVTPQTVWIADLGSEITISGVRLVVRDASAGVWIDPVLVGTRGTTKRTTIRAVGARNLRAANVRALVAA